MKWIEKEIAATYLRYYVLKQQEEAWARACWGRCRFHLDPGEKCYWIKMTEAPRRDSCQRASSTRFQSPSLS